MLRRRPRREVAAGAVAAGLLVAWVLAACVETRRPLGEDCLKNGDCLSGICSGLRCVAAPPFLDGSPEATPDAGVGDAAGDATDDATDSAPAPVDAAEGG
jgi:predicted small secreted protein